VIVLIHEYDHIEDPATLDIGAEQRGFVIASSNPDVWLAAIEAEADALDIAMSNAGLAPPVTEMIEFSLNIAGESIILDQAGRQRLLIHEIKHIDSKKAKGLSVLCFVHNRDLRSLS
jgi:hypothetical protein